ncbi:MAG: calcium-binding protein [Candidatus Omnitrophota bacterium]
MVTIKENKARENRITNEIIVDCYNEEEQAMGWYYYLEDKLRFPFTAKCIMKRSISPIRSGDIVEVIGMAPEEECQHEMFVNIRWQKSIIAVPLAQLDGINVRNKTRESIEDWHYWVKRGYEL